MKLAIMQPYFFPYIGYFQLINSVDKFIIFDNVNYIKKGWVNRNRILINNKEFLITLPVEKVSQNKYINDIYIFDPVNSKDKVLKTIEHAYKKSPEYKNIYPLLKDIVLTSENKLSDYLENITRSVCKFLDITTEITKSSQFKQTYEIKGQDKIIDLCKKIGANIYINPIGGVDIYNGEAFKKENIELLFIKTRDIKYKQYDKEFIANLSILDVLMFNKLDSIKAMLELYDLKKNN